MENSLHKFLADVQADAANAVLQERLWRDHNDAVDTPDELQRGEQNRLVCFNKQLLEHTRRRTLYSIKSTAT